MVILCVSAKAYGGGGGQLADKTAVTFKIINLLSELHKKIRVFTIMGNDYFVVKTGLFTNFSFY